MAGEDIGAFFTSLGDQSEGAAVVETTNPEEASRSRARCRRDGRQPAAGGYDDATYQADPDEPGRVFGIVGDFVQGSLEGFKAAVDAESGDSLGDSTTSRTR